MRNVAVYGVFLMVFSFLALTDVMAEVEDRYNVTIHFTEPDGEPANGTRYQVIAAKDEAQEVVQSGTIEEGVVRLEGLEGGEDVHYMVQVAFPGMYVGSFGLETDNPEHEVSIDMPPRKGQMAPELEVEDLFTGEPVKLSDYRGKYVFLDFWASWCGPCQEPMTHNSEIVERRGDFGGKAVIVALSINDDLEKERKHVKEHGWDNFTQLWHGEAGHGADSTPAKKYVVYNIPTAVLISPEGEILWRGHPEGFNLERRLDRLTRD